MSSTFNNLLIAGVYWVLVGVMSLFSIFGVYLLLRYGKSLALSLMVSLVYASLFLTLLAQSYHFLMLVIS